MKIPILDLTLSNKQEIAIALNKACTEVGFFYIKNHGISIELQEKLENISREFFALPEEQKKEIDMQLGGRAWRGFFPVMGELTSGKPDLKEGIYFGLELEDSHPMVKANAPMYGRNLFPTQLPEMKAIVLTYIEELTKLSHYLMELISLSLELPPSYFNQHFTFDPLVLFRIFHYPPSSEEITKKAPWGVGEHTDYGLFTILKQDAIGGLEVKSNDQWIKAPYMENTFVCNIGDMLEKLTNGYYVSTPHRVLNTSGKNRYSFPFFFDPNFNTELKPIPLDHLPDTNNKRPINRWDNANLHEIKGTYGAYILQKVSKVFPHLVR